jgi:hypothetical protein
MTEITIETVILDGLPAGTDIAVVVAALQSAIAASVGNLHSAPRGATEARSVSATTTVSAGATASDWGNAAGQSVSDAIRSTAAPRQP